MKIKRVKVNGIAAFPRTTCKTKHMDRKYLNKKPKGISIVESAEIESEILAKLPGFKVSEQWQKDGGKFVPKASKFLGERQFEMEPGPLPHTPERKLSVTEQAEANWMRDHPGETI